ncbi:hypothetical protein G5V59_20485 [Nocardioides sp. W3-2-3]|uniref:M1 family aminopeptidase n=1 Tax=Nocardioides convexus TaxID=2712224 RepID=UPI002418AA15|nr:M1 family aminopeptidase [Nocardioides convexus]NHA01408.1 hypothetical protein [Nocardioides convexus]
MDGAAAGHDVDGTHLTIRHPVKKDRQYTLALTYAGTPRTAPAPSTRSDFTQGVGWSISDDHETSTLQEPYGAFTWYAVNDQPSDKALYDFTLTVDAPWQGVANGESTKSTEAGGRTTNRWHLAEPASSYLVTVAFGDYRRTDLKSAGGVPIQVWAPADGEALPGGTGTAPAAIDWLEKILGPYPFDTFGIVVVDNDSGMETQTMVTLGDTDYSLSPEVVVHEAAHHWYGDTVTPADWSDVWMNEGMAMYLQGMWEAEQEGVPVADKMDQWADFEASLRASAGPPAAYDPKQFGDGNIYYGPALMWQEPARAARRPEVLRGAARVAGRAGERQRRPPGVLGLDREDHGRGGSRASSTPGCWASRPRARLTALPSSPSAPTGTRSSLRGCACAPSPLRPVPSP